MYDVSYVENDYQDEYLTNTYNKGRLAILFYGGTAHYISFSNDAEAGRNSSIQSVPTAFNLYYRSKSLKKKLYYYFLNTGGNYETNYLVFIYRLMNTVGFHFLNANIFLHHSIQPFTSIDDIILTRERNTATNRGNNSTYITKSGINAIDIYGKVYGANKYETSLLCYAVSVLQQGAQKITLYELIEQNLKQLPKSSRDVIADMGKIRIVSTNMTQEKTIYEGENLRSPHYIYNLLEHLGEKRCALCGCSIPELVQGAHIWPISHIKKAAGMPYEERLASAIDGNNGLWLCENHHKLFDKHILRFRENGEILLKKGLPEEYDRYISKITTIRRLPEHIVTEKFAEYLRLRNQAIS